MLLDWIIHYTDLIDSWPEIQGCSRLCTLKPTYSSHSLTHTQIKMHTNCMFEVVSVDPVNRVVQPGQDREMEFTSPPPCLRLKGQMLILYDAVSAFFLCSPAYV